MNTRAQKTNLEWVKYHTCTITSSKFKLVGKSRKWSHSVLTAVFSNRNLDHIPAIKLGQQMECIARDAYCEVMTEAGRPVLVKDCGIVLHTSHWYLGDSPDSLVYDVSASHPYGLVKI